MTTRRKFLGFLSVPLVLPVVGPHMLLSERPPWVQGWAARKRGWKAKFVRWNKAASPHDPNVLYGSAVYEVVENGEPDGAMLIDMARSPIRRGQGLPFDFHVGDIIGVDYNEPSKWKKIA